MYKFRKFIAPLTLSVSLILSTAANAAPMEHADPGLRQVLAQLDLSQAQRQDIRQLFRDGRADNEVFRADKRQFRQQLHTLIQNPDWDEAAAGTLLNNQQELKSQLALQRAMSKHKLWLVLDTKQQSKLTKLLAQNKPKHRRDSEGMELLNKLDLSAEQQSQLAHIMAEMQANRQEMGAIHQTFAEAERTLTNAQEFDNTQWLALHASLQAESLALSLSNAQSRNQVWNLLNAEQQQQLAELLKSHRKDSKQHHKHGERPMEI